MKTDRRQFLKLAAALGATLASGCTNVRPSSTAGASVATCIRRVSPPGDPDHHSVLLWTRRPYADGRKEAALRVEVADDPRSRA
jgi:alkaline phosphatase D